MISEADALRAAFADLEGLSIWAVVGGRNGSVFTLDIGARWTVPYRRPPGTKLYGKTHEVGEYSLYVTCAWRLEERRRIVFSSADPGEEGAQWKSAFARMLNRTVRGVSVEPGGWDVALDLGEGLRLSVFCDYSAASDELSNYGLDSPEKTFWLTAGGDLEVEDRTDTPDDGGATVTPHPRLTPDQPN